MGCLQASIRVQPVIRRLYHVAIRHGSLNACKICKFVRLEGFPSREVGAISPPTPTAAPKTIFKAGVDDLMGDRLTVGPQTLTLVV